MNVSEVTIYNWALAAIGTKARLQSPTQAGTEAESCSLWYESVRDLILRSAPWDCARAYSRLAVSAERIGDVAWVDTDPAPGWRFAYALPADHLAPRSLAGFERFELGTNSLNQKVLYTNVEAAILCYTKRQTNPAVWEVDLQHAIAFGLAAHIAMKLTGSKDKVTLVTAQAVDKIMGAREASSNAPQFGYDGVPEWLAARGYGDTAPATKFIYPWAEFSVMGTYSALN